MEWASKCDLAGKPQELVPFAMTMQVMTLNESPAFLLLDTDVSHQHKELPLALFESGEDFNLISV